jgi:hypothetical protein
MNCSVANKIHFLLIDNWDVFYNLMSISEYGIITRCHSSSSPLSYFKLWVNFWSIVKQTLLYKHCHGG